MMLSLKRKNPNLKFQSSAFTETDIQLGLGLCLFFLDTRCSRCRHKMYKEVVEIEIIPNLIRPEFCYLCYRCGIMRRYKIG